MNAPAERPPAVVATGSLRDRLAVLVLVCAAALLVPLAQPLVAGRVFVYNDLTWFHLPMRFLYQQALRAGDSLLWTPAVFSGFYFHGEGQTGVFHPLHLVLYGLLPLRVAFGLELVANYVAAFAGMAWFLRRLRCTRVAAGVGAMLFAFSGFMLLHHHHLNMVAVMAHLPWLLAAADLVIAGDRAAERRAGFALVAIVVASGFLLGFPQAMWWNALALAPFAALRAGETGRWRALVPCVVAGAIGLLLGGIQIVPTADVVARSVRVEVTRDFALSFSLHPWNLIQLWSPWALTDGSYTARDHPYLHEFGLYSGALLPIALGWVWLRRRALPDRRGLIIGATGFAAVMLLLALGRYGGLAEILVHVPVIGALRAPARYLVLAQFALIVLAAIAVDDLVAIVERRTPRPAGGLVVAWVPAGLGLITLAALNGHLLSLSPGMFGSVAEAAPAVALGVAIALCVTLAGRGAGWALAALIVLTAVDLGAYGIGFVRREPARSIKQLIQGVPPAPPAIEETYASAPTSGPYRSNLLVMRGYRLTNGYAGLFPATRHPLDDEASDAAAGARWRFAPHGTRVPLINSAARIRLLDPGGQETTGIARLLIDRPGHLAAQIESQAGGIVALTERFHDGWTATANGAPVAIVRVADDYLGCVVGPGAQIVELRFAPRSFRVGMLLSAIGALLLATALIVWRPGPAPS